MLALLDETDQRRLGILRILSDQPAWITVGEIARRIGASERTIQSDIAYIKNAWNPSLGIEVSQKSGVFLGCRSSAVLHAVDIEVLKQSVAVRFLRELLFYPDQNLEFYMNKLYVSNSTLTRLLPKIDEQLCIVDAGIERNGAFYRLVSKDEQHLRKLLVEFYIEMKPEILVEYNANVEYTIPGTPSTVNFARLFQITRNQIRQIDHSERAELICHDELTVAQMSSFLLLSILRERQGFHAEDDQIFPEINEADYCYLKCTFPDLQPEWIRPVQAFLTKIVLEPENASEAALVRREAEGFYRRLFQKLHVTCKPIVQKNLQQMLCILYSYTKACPLTIAGLPRRLGSFAASMRANNPALYHALQTELLVFSKNTGVDLSPVLPNLIMRACFYFPALARSVPNQNMLVVSDSGIAHANFLAEYINILVNGSSVSTVNIRAISLEEFFSPAFVAHYSDYQILVTTTSALPNSNLFQKVVIFEDFPSKESIYKLHEAIYCNPDTE